MIHINKLSLVSIRSKLKSAKRWKRLLILFSLILVVFIALVIMLISPITKYLVEKYDIKYTGREITMDWAYVNPFTGYIHFSNFKMHELKSDSIFFSAKGVSITISLRKLLSKTYEIRTLKLDQPRGIIIQDSMHLNFSDIIHRLSSGAGKDSLNPAAPVHFNLLNVEISDGELFYTGQVVPVNYSVKKLYLKSRGMYWNVDSINVEYSFQPRSGLGDISGDIMINLKSLDYRLNIISHKLDIAILEQYLKSFANYGSFSANIDSHLKAKGSFKSNQTINLRGDLSINDFHFGKKKGEDYASFSKISFGIIELDPANKKYFFDSVMLLTPFFKFEWYDYLDNYQRMFINKGEAASATTPKFNLIVVIARYIRDLFRNFLQSNYRINSLALKNGNLEVNDYSKAEKFSIALDPLSIKADSIDMTRAKVQFFLESGVKPYGSISAAASMNPKTKNDFDFSYKLQKIPATLFNPYIITATSFPLDRGVIELSGIWNVRNDIIQSTNHFLIIDPRLSKKIRKKDKRWIPMPLIMSLVRERGNVIDYEIPITGNLKNPKFHIRDVVLDMIKNILLKPPSIPYRLEVKNTENEIEKSLSIRWLMRQTTLSETQENFMEKIAGFLKKNPDSHINVYPFQYSEKEKEYILFFEAKKKYFLNQRNKQNGSLNDDDSLSIEKMSSKDPSFVKYLDHYSKDSMLFTIQEKCYRYVGATLVNHRFNQLVREREHVFMGYFKENQTEKQVNLFANQNMIPFNGFSYFKIEYKGDIPKSLTRAYEKLFKLNAEPPRDKYLKFRRGRSKAVEKK